MTYSHETIRKIAIRIERAYRRKYPLWYAVGISPGVWESAAHRLMEVSSDKLGLPIDPELYVAIQLQARATPDPWEELTQQGSLIRYRKKLRKIIHQLRQELTAEITRGECRLLRGLDLDHVLETEGDRLSPLARYILACRAGREDLSMRFHAAAFSQHRSCPLYRLAARSLLPDHAYPTKEPAHESSMVVQEIVSFSRN